MPLDQKYYFYGEDDEESIVLSDLIETLVVRFNEDCAHKISEGGTVIHVFYSEESDVFAVVASDGFEAPAKDSLEFDFCASFASGVCERVDVAPEGELMWLHAEEIGA